MPSDNHPSSKSERARPVISIADLQGIGHRSTYVGERVLAEGIVTAVERRGFHMQMPDDESGPSPVPPRADAVFVFTKNPPDVSVRDRVRVEGTVEEFRRGDTDLTSTQLARRPIVSVVGSNEPLPSPVELGSTAWPLPSGSMYEAGLRYETLESKRVRLPPSRVIGATDKHRDIYVAPDAPGTGLPVTQDGVLRGHPQHGYPARVRLTFDRNLYGERVPQVDVNDRIGPVEGIFTYAHGSFGIKPTATVDTTPGPNKRQVTSLTGTSWGVTVATYNVENLDPKVEDIDLIPGGGRPDDDIGSGKFAKIAAQIVENLQNPDIIAIQEIQDSDGTEASGNADATLTWQTLIDAVADAGGPRYRWVDRAPVPGADGGQPGGNIRVGYLYHPDRVRLINDAVVRVGESDPAFVDGRKSLAAAFEFVPTGGVLHVIANHWASKRGSTPTYRDPNLPKVIGGEAERVAQERVVAAHVDALVATDSEVQIVSMGDFNAPEYGPAVVAHGSGHLVNLGEKTPDRLRYSYIHQGLAEPIDHQFASRNIEAKAEFEYVHVNAAFADKASDHDPTISRIDMRRPRDT